jgi:hypothetical protein
MGFFSLLQRMAIACELKRVSRDSFHLASAVPGMCRTVSVPDSYYLLSILHY